MYLVDCACGGDAMTVRPRTVKDCEDEFRAFRKFAPDYLAGLYNYVLVRSREDLFRVQSDMSLRLGDRFAALYGGKSIESRTRVYRVLDDGRLSLMEKTESIRFC